jgi:hypothetical protein
VSDKVTVHNDGATVLIDEEADRRPMLTGCCIAPLAYLGDQPLTAVVVALRLNLYNLKVIDVSVCEGRADGESNLFEGFGVQVRFAYI